MAFNLNNLKFNYHIKLATKTTTKMVTFRPEYFLIRYLDASCYKMENLSNIHSYLFCKLTIFLLINKCWWGNICCYQPPVVYKQLFNSIHLTISTQTDFLITTLWMVCNRLT